MSSNDKLIWYSIDEFPNSQYEINEQGQIRNTKTGRLLAGYENKDGYLMYSLTIDGKIYSRFAHLLVARQFIPNPNGYPIVNHKDENKMNPVVDNLEWTTYSQNSIYGSAQKKSESQRAKPINEYSLDGSFIRTWKSAKHIYLFLGLPYDEKKRTSYLVKILSNNDKPDSAKMVFANRVFMRYSGSVDDEDFVLKENFKLRNETYLALPEPKDVPDEYLLNFSVEKKDIGNILLSIMQKNKRIFSMKENYAMEYAIRCVDRIQYYENDDAIW